VTGGLVESSTNAKALKGAGTARRPWLGCRSGSGPRAEEEDVLGPDRRHIGVGEVGVADRLRDDSEQILRLPVVSHDRPGRRLPRRLPIDLHRRHERRRSRHVVEHHARGRPVDRQDVVDVRGKGAHRRGSPGVDGQRGPGPVGLRVRDDRVHRREEERELALPACEVHPLELERDAARRPRGPRDRGVLGDRDGAVHHGVRHLVDRPPSHPCGERDWRLLVVHDLVDEGRDPILVGQEHPGRPGLLPPRVVEVVATSSGRTTRAAPQGVPGGSSGSGSADAIDVEVDAASLRDREVGELGDRVGRNRDGPHRRRSATSRTKWTPSVNPAAVRSPAPRHRAGRRRWARN